MVRIDDDWGTDDVSVDVIVAVTVAVIMAVAMAMAVTLIVAVTVAVAVVWEGGAPVYWVCSSMGVVHAEACPSSLTVAATFGCNLVVFAEA